MIYTCLLAVFFMIAVASSCVIDNYPPPTSPARKRVVACLIPKKIRVTNKKVEGRINSGRQKIYHRYDGRTYTTILKGIAIILVLLSHFAGSMSRILTPLGGIGVAMFLLLSGYGLNESFKKNGLKKFWSKRLVRLWIPYIMVLAVLCVAQHHDIIWLAQNIILYHCPYWFIQYIIVWYIVFWIVSRFFSTHRVSIMFALGLTSLFATSGVQGEQALSFPVGIMLSTLNLKFDFRKILIPTKIAISLLILGIFMLALKQSGWYRMTSSDILINIINMPIKLGLGLSIVFFPYDWNCLRDNKFLIFTGVISYELYLTHCQLFSYTNGNLAIAISLIILSYLLAYILYRFDKIISNFISGKL